MKRSDITVRVAHPEDATNIAQVHIQSWQETYRGLMPDGYLDNLDSIEGERRLANWKKNLTNSETMRSTWVAEIDDEIIGFVSVGKGRDKEPIAEGEIYAIYLLKAYHGSGIGRALFDAGISVLKAMNMTSASLWVAKGNSTEGFYKHLGGVLQGEKIDKCGGVENLAEHRYVWRFDAINLPKLRIREVIPADAHCMNQYWADNTEEDLRRLGEISRPDLTGNIEFIEQFCRDRLSPDRADEGILIWELNASQIGYCTLKEIHYGSEAQIHLHMWEKNQRGKGIGAVLFCLSALRFISEFKLKTLYCQPKFDNPMPNRMLKKIGFKLLGTVEWKHPINGTLVPQNKYLITEDVIRKFLNTQKGIFSFESEA